jgi:tRNA dimethylallyltransferase
VSDEASVAAYQVDALGVIADIQARGAVPILVGGSGLYVSSVLYDFRFPGTDSVVRERLEAELAETGPGKLHQRLLTLDPDAARSIGPSNGRRLVRALEVIEITGEKFGSGLPDESAFRQPTVVLGLQTPRGILVDRLDDRVRQMWAAGLLDEVREIGPGSMGITMSEAEAIEQTAALTRRYARRQVGWFRRYPGTTWLDSDDEHRTRVALDTIGL